MEHFRYFILPFYLGVLFLFATLIYKYVKWFAGMPAADRKRFWRSIPTRATLKSIAEVVKESLLHLRIWRSNQLLGYMHTCFALGWFLLIVVGWIEAQHYFKGQSVPLYVDIFFSYYVHPLFESGLTFSFFKDLLLLIILSGVALAGYKRVRSRIMGMRRTTRHVWGDRLALGSLWMIFPARLLAESLTSAQVSKFGGEVWLISANAQLVPPGAGCGSFLTGNLGQWLSHWMPASLEQAQMVELGGWWLYSWALGIFFVALPFSRYMHIFTEIPLIFLRNAGITSGECESSFDRFQTEACSRCGLCIDPCQLQSAAGMDQVQAVYFLRDRRYGKLTDAVADHCLMCGRCTTACPVGIEQNKLRLNARQKQALPYTPERYAYLEGKDSSEGAGSVGYFAGCMTLLTPKIMWAMEKIFNKVEEQVWWADKSGGVCCGRPLKLSGEIDAARRIMDHNEELFCRHDIRTLVTSCPICLKVFKEDYTLEGVEVLHHSEYIERLIDSGRLTLKASKQAHTFTYHDPCELGRGGGIYEAPRTILQQLGVLYEPSETRENALCCGSSLANTSISDQGQRKIGWAVAKMLSATGADSIVTACPLCKKGVGREAAIPVYDLAEVVAQAI